MSNDSMRRTTRTPAGGSTTDTQFMGSEPLTESVGGTYTAAYAYGNDQLRRNGEYPQFDGTGSVRGETSSSQAVTYTQNTDSFGNQVGSSGSTASSAKFSGDWGYQTDGDAGLIHVGVRYYDPQAGNFATRDTMLNRIPYAYCGGDGVDWADPDGDARVPIWLQKVATIVWIGVAIANPKLGVIGAIAEGGDQTPKIVIQLPGMPDGSVGSGGGDSDPNAIIIGGTVRIGVGIGRILAPEVTVPTLVAASCAA